MRWVTVKQRVKEFFWGDSLYKKFFDEKSCVFIHIPKAAGTAVSNALYGGDPWHYSAQETRAINNKKFDSYYKFAVVRHPVTRLVSTYNYAQTHIKKYPGTSLAFMSKYNSFEDFILNWLTAENVGAHYFFWTLEKYLCDSDGRLMVDAVIKMENLSGDIKVVENKIGHRLDIKTMNVSKKTVSTQLDDAVIQRIFDVYNSDFNLFGYKING